MMKSFLTALPLLLSGLAASSAQTAAPTTPPATKTPAATAPATTAPAAACDAASGRCTVTTRMAISGAQPGAQPLAATLGVQIGRDGTDPMLFALAPLGVAVRPGLRAVLPGPVEVRLAVDVCLPDGCRATGALDAAQFAALRTADTVELQFFAHDRQAPLAATIPVGGLAEALAAAGATLPAR